MEKSALILSPHVDDETYGCGGLISKLSRRGWSVRVLFGVVGTVELIRNGSRQVVLGQTRSSEADKVGKILGFDWSAMYVGSEREVDFGSRSVRELLGHIEPYIENGRAPDLLIGPAPSTHQDHNRMWEVFQVLTRPGYMPKTTMLAYDPHLLWMSHVNNLQPNVHVVLDEQDLVAKAAALDAYASQAAARGLTHDVIGDGNRLMGSRNASGPVEAFSLIRMTLEPESAP